MATMDSEKFFENLRDAVNDTRKARDAADASPVGTQERMRASMDHRRAHEILVSTIEAHPEEFAGLLLALATSANETYAHVNGRLARLEESVTDIRNHLLGGEQLV